MWFSIAMSNNQMVMSMFNKSVDLYVCVCVYKI